MNNNKIEEITFELTNFCPFNCKYCSSNAVSELTDERVWYLPLSRIEDILDNKYYKYIILSGGEPLSHPNFYLIWKKCKQHCDDLIVYTNLLTHIIFNPNVIDGIIKECNLNVNPDIDKIHILKRIKQGKQSERPEIHFSKNWEQKCKEGCSKYVVRGKEGNIFKSPCNKYEKVNKGKKVKWFCDICKGIFDKPYEGVIEDEDGELVEYSMCPYCDTWGITKIEYKDKEEFNKKLRML